jgi:ABC-type Zn uptake system ZnuABC Zn-binding protein ZnuA
MNSSKHSPQTLERLRANAEAAKKRLNRLNNEYLVRQKVRKTPSPKVNTSAESFSEAVSRIAKESQIVI